MSKQEVVICHNLEENLQKAVTSKTYDKLFILTDEHTRTYCLPIIEKYPFLAQAEHICIGVEDIHKNLETLAYVWSQLSNKGFNPYRFNRVKGQPFVVARLVEEFTKILEA